MNSSPDSAPKQTPEPAVVGRVDNPSPSEQFASRLREGTTRGFARASIVLIIAIPFVLFSFRLNWTDIFRMRHELITKDLQSLDVALQAYEADFAAYPHGARYHGPMPKLLTTPIPYLDELPVDLFSTAYRAESVRNGYVFLIAVALVPMILGLLVFLLAWRTVARGEKPARFQRALRLGFWGFSWMALSVLVPAAVLIIYRSFEVLSKQPFDHFVLSTSATPLSIATLVILVAFGSGIRRAMKGTLWRLPIWLEIVAIVFWFVFAFAVYAGANSLIDSRLGRGNAIFEGGDAELALDRHYNYATDGATGWIIWSQGPDAEIDLLWPIRANLGSGDFGSTKTLHALVPAIYDPTNGIESKGDIAVFGALDSDPTQ